MALWTPCPASHSPHPLDLDSCQVSQAPVGRWCGVAEGLRAESRGTVLSLNLFLVLLGCVLVRFGASDFPRVSVSSFGKAALSPPRIGGAPMPTWRCGAGWQEAVCCGAESLPRASGLQTSLPLPLRPGGPVQTHASFCYTASGQGECLRGAVGLTQPAGDSGLGEGSGEAVLILAVLLLPVRVQSV